MLRIVSPVATFLLLVALAAALGGPPVRATIARETPRQGDKLMQTGYAGGVANTVAVQESYGYVGIGAELAVLDVGQPDRPVQVGRLMLPATILDLALADRYAYVAVGVAGLRVLDLTNPRQPSEVGRYVSGQAVERIAVAEGYVYVLEQQGLRIVDVARADAPAAAGYVQTVVQPRALAVAGQYVYVGLSKPLESALYVVDVAKPSAPVVGSTSLQDRISNI